MLVPPGSALLDTADSPQWLGELDSAAFTYRWRHIDSRMDALHQKVATLVERAERAKSNPIETFVHIKAMALSTSGKELNMDEAAQEYCNPRVFDNLTDSWFSKA